MRALAVLALVALVACDGEQSLPEPGAEGPVEVVVWDADEPRPSRLRAARIAVPTLDLERYDLFDVELRRPQERGFVVMHADRGELRLGRDQHLAVDPPIRLSGLLEGLPMLALSSELTYDAETGSALLEAVQAAWSLHRSRAASMRISGGERFQAEAWHSVPGEAGMAAVLGALPHHGRP